MKIIETKDRNILAEGRNTGMAFAFLQRKDNEFHSVQPFSPCKDYLNEVVYTERTGKGSEACGLKYPKKLDIFSNVFYLGIKIMKTQNGQNYYYSKDINVDVAHLKANFKHIEKLLNYFEEIIGLEELTTIQELNDGYFLITGSVEWVKSTYAISLFTLLVRCALVYNGELEPLEFLTSYTYNSSDVNLIKPSIPKLKHILETKHIPEQGEIEKITNFCPHHYGIMSYKLPINELCT